MKLKTILFTLSSLALLASCGGGNGNTSTDSKATAVSSAQGESQAAGVSTEAASSEEEPEMPAGQDIYEDATKIVVWADKSEHETIVTLVNAYNKEANTKVKINVTLKSVSEGDAGSELLKDPKGKNYPSLFAVADDKIAELLDKKTLANLPNNMQNAIKENDTETAVTSVEYDGKIVAFPVQADNGYFLYYDGDAITDEQASTWEGLVAAAKSDAQVLFDIPNGWYANSIFHAQDVCGTESLSWHKNADGKIVYDLTWDNERGVEAASYFSSLVAPAYTDKKLIPGGNAEIQAGFKDGTMIAAVTGTWNYDVLSGLCDNLKARRLPTFTDRNGEHQMGSFTGSKVYAVNAYATADEQKAALLLGNYLTSKEAQLVRYEKRKALPCNKAAMEDDRYAKNVNIAAAALQDQNRFAANQSKSTEGRYWDVGKAIGQSIQTGKTGTTDWAGFLKEQCDILRTAPAD